MLRPQVARPKSSAGAIAGPVTVSVAARLTSVPVTLLTTCDSGDILFSISILQPFCNHLATIMELLWIYNGSIMELLGISRSGSHRIGNDER